MLIKVIKFTLKYQILVFDFNYSHIPFCNFPNSVSEKLLCCLTFVCVYTYTQLFLPIENRIVIQGKRKPELNKRSQDMLSRDQPHYIMTSSVSKRDTLTMLGTKGSKRSINVYLLNVKRCFPI